MGSVYSVSQANQYIKNMFTQDFLLNNISVKGEVSNCKYHSSGHIYFSIKDRNGVLSCIMFAGKRRGLDFRLEEGQNVVVSGNINVYERDGKYQLYADRIEKEGTGDLYKRFLQLKNELEDMGMFAEEYKKPIPKYAESIGIITASTGAAIQDVINISKRRNPYVRLILYPAKVQGEGASDTVVHGIEYFNEKRNVDVLIVGRGGGSIEDLWAFNEENVARAIFASEIPVISAVGHETDFTIADFVADLRAPTPSAAAELAVFEYQKLIDLLDKSATDLEYRVRGKVAVYRQKIGDIKWRLDKMSPANSIQSKRQRLADLEIKLNEVMTKKIVDRRHRFQLLAQRLDALSPLSRLAGGYAYVSIRNGAPLKSVKQIKTGETLKITVADGSVEADVTDVTDTAMEV